MSPRRSIETLRRDARIRSREGGEFDCYLATPRNARSAPAVVLASAIHGVDGDLRAIADEFACHGHLAAAPDLFWRTVPGPLARGDARAVERAEPRRERIRASEQDLYDVRLWLRDHERFDGHTLLMGFCYGGPYAVIAPSRLGYDAGIACHGSGMLDAIAEAQAARLPVCVLWGDRDRMAPPEVRKAYLDAQGCNDRLAVHIFRGVEHGYMMRDSAAFDARAREASFECALQMLRALAISGRSSPAAGTP